MSSKPSSRPTPLRPLLLAALLLAALGCGAGRCGTAPGQAALPPADAGVARRVHLQVLAFNDFHGNLEPPSGKGGEVLVEGPDGADTAVPAGGAAHLAALLTRLKREAPHTVVVSAGDLVGASPLLSALFHDEPSIEAANLMGLTLHAVGNHEFDDGVEELKRLQHGGCHPTEGCSSDAGFAGARFPFLAANVLTDAGTPLLAPYVVHEVEGVKVAFLGLTLEGTPTIVKPSGVAGLSFRDEVETVNQLVPQLRGEGVEAFVLVLHEGGEPEGHYDGCQGVSGPIVDIAHQVDDAVDVIVSGHTHAAYNCVIDGKRVTSALSAGRLVTDLDLQLDAETGDVVEVAATNRIVVRDAGTDAEVEALIARYAQRVGRLRERRVGRTTEPLIAPRHGTTPSGEATLGHVMADAQLAATRAREAGGAQLALVNPGGIRADLPGGEVSYEAAFATTPFGNSLVTLTLTGTQLHAVLEQQWTGDKPRLLCPSRGFTYRWSEAAPPGRKVDPRSLRLHGRPVQPEGRYRVTVNSFLATGGDGFTVFRQGQERLGGPLDIDALVGYLAVHSPLRPPRLDRIRRVP